MDALVPAVDQARARHPLISLGHGGEWRYAEEGVIFLTRRLCAVVRGARSAPVLGPGLALLAGVPGHILPCGTLSRAWGEDAISIVPLEGNGTTISLCSKRNTPVQPHPQTPGSWPLVIT